MANTNLDYLNLDQIQLNPYQQLLMRGLGPGLAATTGYSNPSEVLSIPLSLAQPPVTIPRIRPQGTLGQIAAAPFNVGASLLEGISSPLGAAMIPLGMSEFAPAVAGLGAGLAAKQAGQMLGQASVTGSPGQMAEGALWGALSPTAAFAGLYQPRGQPAAPEMPNPPTPTVSPPLPKAWEMGINTQRIIGPAAESRAKTAREAFSEQAGMDEESLRELLELMDAQEAKPEDAPPMSDSAKARLKRKVKYRKDEGFMDEPQGD